jgi:PAS domain S-box-containing protein
MDRMNADPHAKSRLPDREEDLRRRLEEAEQTLEAIRHGEVDAIVVAGAQGDMVYSLTGAEHAYRVIVETMNEAALTTDLDGTILFCNQRFCDLMRAPMHEALGRNVSDFAAGPQQPVLKTIMTKAQAEPVREHLALRAADGTVVPVLLSAGLLRTPDSVSLCLVASDLTELEESANSIRVLRENQQALQESEDRYHCLFEDDLTGNFVSTPEGQVLLCNPSFARIFGFSSAQEAVGTSMLDLYIEPGTRVSLLERLKQEGKLERLEVWRKRRNGEPIYVVENVIGRFNDLGELEEIKGYIFDDTDRKRAEEALRESEERFRTMADGSPLIIWVTDRDGRMQFVNRAYREFFGATLEQVQSGGWQPLVHPEDVSTYTEPFMQCLRAHMPFHAQGRVRRHDGQWRWIESYGEPRFSASGEFLGIAGSSPDVTEQRQTEDSLRELTQTLETRVAQRTRELESRARQLQKLALELSQAEEQERRRLAEILHDDLQQQLAAVKFHLGILSGRTKDDFGVQRSVGQLDEMLRNAIETSRSLSHELSPAVMYHGDLGEVLEWLANQIRAKHGLLVEVDARGQVDVESEALKTFLYKAVQEMLFNAVKHARVSRARVRLRRRGRCLCVCVSDYGRGFDLQELRRTAGFGLMSIRERVELLGGRMKIHSVKGAGSRFIVTVPDGVVMEDRGRKSEAGGQRTEASGPAFADRVLRVMIADDHEIVRHGLTALLSEAGDVALVGEAGNGREAVDLAYQLRPDVVILDVAMPLMNGDEAARQIRRHLPETRIVALSMYDEAGTAEKMRRAGAEAYLLKTAPADELLAAVRGRK